MASPFIEHADRYEVPDFRGLGVAQIRIDFQFTLLAGPNQVVIEQPFQLTKEGQVMEADPVTRRGLAAALDLFEQVFTEVIAYKGGRLHVMFADGSALDVQPSGQYEAWNLGTGGRGQLVARPGGDLAVWTP